MITPPQAPPPPPRSPRVIALAELLRRPAFDLFIAALIVLSVIGLLAEAPFAHDAPERALLVRLNDVLGIVFAIELALRFAVAPIKRRFFLRYAADLLAIVPSLVGLDVLRALLLLRLFRLGAIGSRLLALRRQAHAAPHAELSLLASGSAILALVGAFTVYTFQSAVRLDVAGWEGSLWFSVYTLVAGEPIGGLPRTQLGRAVTLGLMLGGMAVFGVFIATVSTFMVQILSRRLERNPMEIDELSQHVIVCGWNHSGPTLLAELFAPGSPPGRAVVVITEQKGEPAHLHAAGVPRDLLYAFRGDYTRIEVLEQAGIHRASMAILLADASQHRSAHDQDARTVLAALTIERIASHVFCCAELHDEQHAPLLRMQGVEEVVVSNWLTGVILGSVGRTHGLMPVITDILSAQRENAFHKAALPPAYVGWTVERVHRYLKHHHDAILVSLERNGDPGQRCAQHVNPPKGERLLAGDVLVVISRGPVTLAPEPALLPEDRT